MSTRADVDDLDLKLAGIDGGGNDAPNVWYDQDANVWVYRVSSVGNCEKQLGLFRQGVEGSPPPADMLRRFRDGHLHERAILAEIQKKRPEWKVHLEDPYTKGQFETVYVVKEPSEDGTPGIEIRGHIDGLAVNKAMNPDSRICEAKALSQDNFNKFVKAWEQGNVWDLYPYYRDSISLYMASLEVPCFYAVKNKNSGEVRVFNLDEIPGDVDALAARVRVIDARAARDQVPELCDIRSYPCPMFRFHTEADESDDPEDIMASAMGKTDEDVDVNELEVLCREYDSFREAEKEGKARKKETGIKIAEKFLVTADKVETANYRVAMKEHTYRFLDEEEMREDGIDVEKYRKERKTEYPDVRKKGKKK